MRRGSAPGTGSLDLGPSLTHLRAVRRATREARRLLVATGMLGCFATAANAVELDWRKLGDETTELLANVLRIDTTNPPGGEIAAANALARKLTAEGIAAEVIESAPGRGSLYAHLPGRGGFFVQHLLDDVEGGRADEGRLAGEEFVQDGA